ncbi:MAG: rubredoxin [Spirochaetia bacterium]|nr:rubredoxin [Spirochaetia bacterium]
MEEDMREMSPEELGAVCSNLSKTSAKQMRPEEADLFGKLSAYYGKQASKQTQRTEKEQAASSFKALATLIEQDLTQGYALTSKAIQTEQDRGAQRSLVWGEKVTKLLKSLLTRYEKQGNALLENTSVFVCDICGFVYVGEQPPEVCPVCKVPSFKILPVRKEAI